MPSRTAPSLRPQAADERVTKYVDWQPTPRLDVLKTKDRYADLAADMAQGKRIAWVIRKLDEERLCGKIELRIGGTDDDIGYVLGVSHWGQGIVPEAVTAALNFARRLCLRRVPVHVTLRTELASASLRSAAFDMSAARKPL
jgi:RimJ/RimL family protein N-acetyltransferase